MNILLSPTIKNKKKAFLDQIFLEFFSLAAPCQFPDSLHSHFNLESRSSLSFVFIFSFTNNYDCLKAKESEAVRELLVVPTIISFSTCSNAWEFWRCSSLFLFGSSSEMVKRVWKCWCHLLFYKGTHLDIDRKEKSILCAICVVLLS